MEPLRKNDPYKPKSKGLKVTGSPKQLELLNLFTRYEALPTSYFQAPIGRHYANDLITLFNTEGYIRIAPGSKRRLDARNKEAIWEGTDKGEMLLGKPFIRETDHFNHKIRRMFIRYSFDAALKEIPGLTMRRIADILAHPDCPPGIHEEKAAAERAQREFNPSTFTIDDYTVVPDEELFGLRLGARSFYALIEVNGQTETYTPKTKRGKKKKNITKMIKAYGQLLARDLHFVRWGLKNIEFLILADTQTDKEAIKEVIMRDFPQYARKFALKIVPDFTEGYPPPTGHMVTEDWETADGGTLNILNILENKRGSKDTEGPRADRAA